HAQARDLVPWNTDLIPRVEVEFSQIDGTCWRIEKSFASGGRGWALLQRCGIEEAKGPAVDAKRREVLAWGVPGSGHGIATSYLCTALLGRQDNVGAILETKLDDDGTDSGRILITKALGQLGQNPVVNRLLE